MIYNYGYDISITSLYPRIPSLRIIAS